MNLAHALAVDSILIARIRAGDERAFEELFRRYYRELCRYAARFDATTGTPEEIVQEVFFRVWRNREQLLEVKTFSSYLYTAVRNQAFNRRKREQTAARWREAKEVEVQADPVGAPAADEEVRAAELAAAIERAIEQLPPRCRQVFLLHRREHRTCPEIAEMLQIAPKTVEVHIGNALKQLRAALAAWM